MIILYIVFCLSFNQPDSAIVQIDTVQQDTTFAEIHISMKNIIEQLELLIEQKKD